MKHNFLKSIDGALQIWGTDDFKPVWTKRMFQNYGFEERMKEWRESFTFVATTKEEDKKKWIDLARKDIKYAGAELHEALLAGIEIESTDFEVVKHGICCMTSKEYPFHGPHCDFCDDYKDGFYAIVKCPISEEKI